jgi:AraC family transcriptional regulator
MLPIMHQRPARLVPEDLPRLLPSRPILSSSKHDWAGVLVQLYKHPPSKIVLPPIRDNMLVLNLAGPTLIEERRDGGHLVRRWADRAHVSLTPAGEPVSRVLKGSPEVLLIHLTSELVAEVAADVYGPHAKCSSLLPCLAVRDDTLDCLGRLLMTEATNEPGAAGTRLNGYLLTRSIIIRLLRNHSDGAALPPEFPNNVADRRIRRSIDYMNAQLEESLGVEELSMLSGLSSSQFGRLFRETTGKTPHRYIMGLRMDRARDFLEHSDLSVIEIGLRCGFEQPSHFSTMFRKQTGFNPRAWRAARRQ